MSTNPLLDDISAILAKGVLRYIRVQQASDCALGCKQNQASTNDLLGVPRHGSLTRELTDTEPGKEDTSCQ